MIENQIDFEQPAADMDRLLPADKSKPFSQFQQEGTQIADQRFFQIALRIDRQLRQSRKLEDIRIFDHVLRFFNDLAFLREAQHFFLITAQGEPVIKHAFHLPFQFPDTPPACFRFPFVKCPFLRIINLEKLDIMAPGQKSGHCLDFWIKQIKPAHAKNIASSKTVSILSA